jgi:hypothetical protein
MYRRTGIASTMLAAITLVPIAAPAVAAAEPTDAQVTRADLQMDGSVKTQVAVTCPEGSTYQLQVAISQEFEVLGSYVAAIAYSPSVTGICTGKTQRIATQTTPSDRAPFQRYFGKHIPPSATRPTSGTVSVTVTSADGLTIESYTFANDVALR